MKIYVVPAGTAVTISKDGVAFKPYTTKVEIRTSECRSFMKTPGHNDGVYKFISAGYQVIVGEDHVTIQEEKSVVEIAKIVFDAKVVQAMAQQAECFLRFGVTNLKRG